MASDFLGRSSEALQYLPLSLALSEHSWMFIELWAGPTIEASARETVVYWSVEKALFTGATCSISSEALQCLFH